LFTNNSAARLLIDTSGNVGVGTTSPNGRLDVSGAILLPGSSGNTMTRPAVGTSRVTGEISGYSVGAPSQDDGFLRLSAGGGTSSGVKSYIDLSGYSQVADMTQNIVFGTSNAERMRITSAGNVGINQTSPGSTLDVKGTLRLSGSTSGYVGIAPAAAAGSTTYTLPSADGSSGQVLSTNGSGTLSWATAGGGSVPSGTWCGAATAYCSGTTKLYSGMTSCNGSTLSYSGTCAVDGYGSYYLSSGSWSNCPSGYTARQLTDAYYSGGYASRLSTDGTLHTTLSSVGFCTKN
jgi:hypothetical protein